MSEKKSSAKWWDDSMDLPPGKTCKDCYSFPTCRAFLGAKIADNVHCDWAPSAFREASHD